MPKKSKEIKSKSLFDHINQIKRDKNPNYYDELTDQEIKGFNQYVILMGLSMNRECIDEVSYLSKYLNIIPNKQFYKMCCDVIPYDKKFHKWIKNTNEKINNEIVEKVAQYHEVGWEDARQYCDVLIDSNIDELKNILSKFGLNDKEIKGLLK